MNSSGYLHLQYANSLAEYGIPLELPASQGWILKRRIPGSNEFDGMGCYPIFACQDWLALQNDLAQIEGQLICLSLVTDPFGRYNQQDLLNIFVDIVRPYKQHFVIDISQSPEHFVAVHHQRNAVKALRTVAVDVSTSPLQLLDEWLTLYAHLIERHHIQGMTRFSRDAFAKQLSVPDTLAFRAQVDGKTVGMLLWYVQGQVAYYHLGAYSPDGYTWNASFALFWKALEYFASHRLQWLSLGAGAGVQGNETDGLTRFKRGWSTGTRTAYFCGRIFDHKKYREIIKQKELPPTDFFPAYRQGEF